MDAYLTDLNGYAVRQSAVSDCVYKRTLADSPSKKYSIRKYNWGPVE